MPVHLQWSLVLPNYHVTHPFYERFCIDSPPRFLMRIHWLCRIHRCAGCWKSNWFSLH
jgi:hypothetical protein